MADGGEPKKQQVKRKAQDDGRDATKMRAVAQAAAAAPAGPSAQATVAADNNAQATVAAGRSAQAAASHAPPARVAVDSAAQSAEAARAAVASDAEKYKIAETMQLVKAWAREKRTDIKNVEKFAVTEDKIAGGLTLPARIINGGKCEKNALHPDSSYAYVELGCVDAPPHTGKASLKDGWVEQSWTTDAVDANTLVIQPSTRGVGKAVKVGPYTKPIYVHSGDRVSVFLTQKTLASIPPNTYVILCGLKAVWKKDTRAKPAPQDGGGGLDEGIGSAPQSRALVPIGGGGCQTVALRAQTGGDERALVGADDVNEQVYKPSFSASAVIRLTRERGAYADWIATYGASGGKEPAPGTDDWIDPDGAAPRALSIAVMPMEGTETTLATFNEFAAKRFSALPSNASVPHTIIMVNFDPSLRSIKSDKSPFTSNSRTGECCSFLGTLSGDTWPSDKMFGLDLATHLEGKVVGYSEIVASAFGITSIEIWKQVALALLSAAPMRMQCTLNQPGARAFDISRMAYQSNTTGLITGGGTKSIFLSYNITSLEVNLPLAVMRRCVQVSLKTALAPLVAKNPSIDAARLGTVAGTTPIATGDPYCVCLSQTPAAIELCVSHGYKFYIFVAADALDSEGVSRLPPRAGDCLFSGDPEDWTSEDRRKAHGITDELTREFVRTYEPVSKKYNRDTAIVFAIRPDVVAAGGILKPSEIGGAVEMGMSSADAMDVFSNGIAITPEGAIATDGGKILSIRKYSDMVSAI